jgi:hypothetical protein
MGLRLWSFHFGRNNPVWDYYLSLGNIINANITIKNRNVCKKNPFTVGQPPLLAIVMKEPKICCINLNVSGFATRKKTNVL